MFVCSCNGFSGSGKTTQVPQYCLEQAAARGESCNIVVAQPRRISAMSVAERVASERGERIGDTVGLAMPLNTPSANPYLTILILNITRT